MRLTIYKLILVIFMILSMTELSYQKARGGGGGRSSGRSSGGYSASRSFASSYSTSYSYYYGRYSYVTVGPPGGWWWVVFIIITFTIIFMIIFMVLVGKCLNVHCCSVFCCIFCCKCGSYREWDRQYKSRLANQATSKSQSLQVHDESAANQSNRQLIDDTVKEGIAVNQQYDPSLVPINGWPQTPGAQTQDVSQLLKEAKAHDYGMGDSQQQQQQQWKDQTIDASMGGNTAQGFFPSIDQHRSSPPIQYQHFENQPIQDNNNVQPHQIDGEQQSRDLSQQPPQQQINFY